MNRKAATAKPTRKMKRKKKNHREKRKPSDTCVVKVIFSQWHASMDLTMEN